MEETSIEVTLEKTGRKWREFAVWVSRHELRLLAVAMLLLIFPAPWSFLALLIILGIWIRRWLVLGYLTLPTPLDMPLLILLTMALVSCFVAADPARGFRRLTWIVAQVTLLYSLLNCLRTRRDIWRYGQGLIAFTLAFAFVSFIGTDWQSAPLIDLPGLYDHIPENILGFSTGGLHPSPLLFNPRVTGATLAMLLPLSLVMLFTSQGRRRRFLSLAALLTGSMVLFLSQATMGLLGFGLSLLFIAIWWRRWMLWPVIVGLLLLVGVVLIYDPQQMLLLFLDIDSDLGLRSVLRLDIWSRTLAMIQDMPFTGIGLDNFAEVQTHFYTGHLLGSHPHAHNLLLQTTLDLGIPGTVALIWLVLAFLVLLVSAYRTTSSREIHLLLVGLGACGLAFFTGGLTDAIPIGEIHSTIMWAILGLAAATVAVTREQSPKNDRLWKLASDRRLLAIPILMLFISFLLFPSVLQRNLSLIPAQQAIYEVRTTDHLPSQKANQSNFPFSQAIDRTPTIRNCMEC